MVPGSNELHQAVCRQARAGGRPLHSSALLCRAAREVEVSHILLAPGSAQLAAELKQRIEGGEPLADLAKEHSKCPSRSNGGSLGWVSRGRTVPEFEAAAFGAAPGQLATCETRFGVHLLQVTGEREAAEVVPMSPQELQESLMARAAGGNEDVQYVDVREEREEQLARLPHFKLLPLSRFEDWAPSVHSLLDKEKETVCLCHHGVRSQQAAQWLLSQGFTNVRNATGGIDAYSRAVDPSVPQY
ncbi:rhodanese-like domain-containing 12 [Micractinium conductrix]|uniref:Peptidyl-prolyl cis-trans isomerase n=1 Tax=Micractinium conductrix TaxID=554055 RepID=A0A2P6VIQ3_9CHLO|nr:rhodanese-like domain-containing 12 [Micractinium conductrix]|eukprot:PSC73976.1 rhodanese-like domain-containing 12 [Micractinium conductrix]